MGETLASVPPPFPYQGGKRRIASEILPWLPADIGRVIEPFCGAGAVSIAAAANGFCDSFWLNDLNAPLMRLWEEILQRPARLAARYGELWRGQQKEADKKAYFFRIRAEFNADHQPERLLFLLARIVKSAVRYSAAGDLNQSADNRRLGMSPKTMGANLGRVSRLLAGKTALSAGDFRDVIGAASGRDLLYLDPPYQGTSFVRDHRYFRGLARDRFIAALADMNARGLSYIVSYDGATGAKQHGEPLPAELSLIRLPVHAGRSAQSTLQGGAARTVESLYLSPALAARRRAAGGHSRAGTAGFSPSGI